MSYRSTPSYASSSASSIDLDQFPTARAQSHWSSAANSTSSNSASNTASSTRKSSASSLSSFEAAISTAPPKASDFEWPAACEDGCSDHTIIEKTSEELPRLEALRKAADLPVWDASGRERSFKSIYLGGVIGGGWPRRRILVVFLRWFYCHACQGYVRALKQSLTPSAANRSSAPIPTEIILIGCGKPSLVNQYIERTRCPFPVYTDPTLRIFKALGCKRFGGLCMGKVKPEYTEGRSSSCVAVGTMLDMAKAIYAPEGMALRPSPDPYFNRRSARSSGASADEEHCARPSKRISLDGMRGGPKLQVGGEFLFEDGELLWCHRMKNVRDHAEMRTLRRVLDMDDEVVRGEREATSSSPSYPAAARRKDGAEKNRSFILPFRRKASNRSLRRDGASSSWMTSRFDSSSSLDSEASAAAARDEKPEALTALPPVPDREQRKR